MFVGIGFVGLLTGTITTYFLNRNHYVEEEDHKTELVINVSDLNDDKVKSILDYIEFIRNRS